MSDARDSGHTWDGLTRETREAVSRYANVELLEALLRRLPADAREVVIGWINACITARRTDARAESSTAAVRELRGARLPPMLSDIVFDDPELQALFVAALAPGASRSARIEAPDSVWGPAVGLAMREHDSTEPALLIRWLQLRPADLILLQPTSSVELLDAALDQLALLRARGSASAALHVTAIDAATTGRALPTHWARFLGDLLRRLSAAPVESLPEVGTVRFIEVNLRDAP